MCGNLPAYVVMNMLIVGINVTCRGGLSVIPRNRENQLYFKKNTIFQSNLRAEEKKPTLELTVQLQVLKADSIIDTSLSQSLKCLRVCRCPRF